MNKLFEVHMLNESGKVKAQEIAKSFDDQVTFLESVCTDGREFAIVRTKLEEASFFAKKAMAINPENQA